MWGEHWELPGLYLVDSSEVSCMWKIPLKARTELFLEEGSELT